MMKWPKRLICCAGILMLFAVGAMAVEPITLSVGSGVANPGSTVEITVSLVSENEQPSTLVLYMAYDGDRLLPDDEGYELISRDLTGAPLVDNDGNAVVRNSAVRVEAAASEAERAVEYEIHDGVLAVILSGASANIRDGDLFTIAFKVLDGVTDLSAAPITIVSKEDPVQIDTLWVSSSASTGDSVESMPLLLNAGQVTLVCTPAGLPTAVDASQGRADGVQVSWTPVETSGATYRVYRSESNDTASAVALGDAWQSATTFLDESAEVPEEVSPGMCFSEGVYEEVYYYYWVKARTPEGCEGDFSTTPAQGYRGAAKAFYEEAKVAAPDLPDAGAAALSTIAPDASVAIRLSADQPVDEASLWVEAPAACDFEAQWLPDADQEAWGGWLRCVPQTLWPSDSVLTLRCGGLTVDGDPIGPLVRVYQVLSAADLSHSDGKSSVAALHLDLDTPTFGEGIGEVYRIFPAGPYPAGEWIWLPVPQGVDAARLKIFYYAEHAGYAGWHDGALVENWLMAGPVLEEEAGQQRIGYQLRYGGVAQLGMLSDIAPMTASVAPLFDTKRHGGDVILGALVLVIFGLCTAPRVVARKRLGGGVRD